MVALMIGAVIIWGISSDAKSYEKMQAMVITIIAIKPVAAVLMRMRGRLHQRSGIKYAFCLNIKVGIKMSSQDNLAIRRPNNALPKRNLSGMDLERLSFRN